MLIASDIHERGKGVLATEELEIALDEDRHRTLIIPGDLTCSAKEREYHQVTDWLMAVMASGVRIILAVGNHDMTRSLGFMRIPKKKGYLRFDWLAQRIAQQSIEVLRMDGDEFDMIYRVDRDVFYAPRTTHSSHGSPQGSRKTSSGGRSEYWLIEDTERRMDTGFTLLLIRVCGGFQEMHTTTCINESAC